MLESVEDARKNHTDVARDILREMLGAPVVGKMKKRFVSTNKYVP